MFKDDFTATGFYKDEDLRVDTTLENPLNYEVDDLLLWFSFELIPYNDSTNTLNLNEMNFYIIAEKDYRIANEIERLEVESEFFDEDNVAIGMKTIVAFEFKPEYLYYNTYIGFRCKYYDGIIFIPLQH